MVLALFVCCERAGCQHAVLQSHFHLHSGQYLPHFGLCSAQCKWFLRATLAAKKSNIVFNSGTATCWIVDTAVADLQVWVYLAEAEDGYGSRLESVWSVPLEIRAGAARQKSDSCLPKAFGQWIQRCSGGEGDRGEFLEKLAFVRHGAFSQSGLPERSSVCKPKLYFRTTASAAFEEQNQPCPQPRICASPRGRSGVRGPVLRYTRAWCGHISPWSFLITFISPRTKVVVWTCWRPGNHLFQQH